MSKGPLKLSFAQINGTPHSVGNGEPMVINIGEGVEVGAFVGASVLVSTGVFEAVTVGVRVLVDCEVFVGISVGCKKADLHEARMIK